MTDKTNYLAKLLTLLVKRSNGSIRIPIQDLMVDDIGQGIQVHFDQEPKELVLTFVPAGSSIYKIEGATTWLTNDLLPLSPKAPKRPLSQEELIAQTWVQTAGTPTLSESLTGRSSKEKGKVVTLTTESMAEAEVERRKQEVMRELENYQPLQPQPATRPTRSRPLQTFSKQ